MQTAANFEVKTSYAITITANDGVNATVQAITVSVNDLNDNAPVFADVNYDISIVENTKGPTLLETTDADADSTVTYSLSGADADDFEIVNNTLALKDAADFETKTSYAVTVTANDGVNSTDQAVTYTITDANDNAPVFADVNYDITIVENTKGPTLLVTTDADANSTVTYSLSGANADDFEIVNNTLALKDAADFETKTAYAVTVTANDGVNSTDQAVTYTITDANDNAPVFTSTATPVIDENTNEVVTLATTDADTNPTVTYSITGGADADKFNLSSSGALSLKTTPDFESLADPYDINPPAYQVTVKADDGINTANQNISVNILDVEEDVSISVQNLTSIEGNTFGPYIFVNDLDSFNEFFTSIGKADGSLTITGPDANAFEQYLSAGVMVFKQATDYETKSQYNVTIEYKKLRFNTVTKKDIVINITDANDNAPVFTSNAAVSIDENTTDVVTLATTDADTNPTVTYSITGGADADKFNLSSSGALSLKTTPDFESLADPYDINPPAYQVTVKADDGINTANQNISVNILDVEEDVSISVQNLTSIEGNTFGPYIFVNDLDSFNEFFTSIGKADGSLTITGPDANAFEQYLSAGVMVFKQATDYETKSQYNVTIEYKKLRFNTVTKKDIVINITDANDNAPVFTSNAAVSIDENTTDVVTLATTDADTNPTVSYSITGGADADDFAVDQATGALTLKVKPDFESGKTLYLVKVEANDGVNSTDQTITVSVNDINEAPVFNQTGQIGLNEGTINVGQISASDPEGEDLTFELTGSNDIEISESGYLKFITAPDFETKSEYTAIIIATDPAGNAAELDTVFTIRDVNEAPVFTSGTAFTFDENATSAITTITTTDEDTDSVVTYQITGGTDGARFAVNSTGVLTFSGFIPDFENPLFSNDNDYEVTVTASDGTNTTDQTITVSVNDLNDNAPVFADVNYDISIVENTKGPTLLETTDADADSTVTYSLSGADADDFEIVNNTLALKDAADFETKTSYAVTVTAYDGVNEASQAITVTVNNLNDERPIITSPTQFVFEVPENFPLQTKIPGTDITGYDPDGTEIEVCSHAILDGVPFKKGVTTAGDYFEDGVNACHLVFGSEAVIDYESGIKQYRTLISIYEKDYAAFSAPIIFTVNITDVNEAPTITSTTTAFSAAENQTTIEDGAITASDQDVNDTLTFSVSGDVLTIDAETGVLSFATAPDFETTTEAITATVTVTDAAGLADTQEVTVTVTDVNDNAPVFTSDSTFTIDEKYNSSNYSSYY